MGFVLWNWKYILISGKKAKQVLGVEIVPEAIADAKINAKINNIDNAEFFVGAAEDVVTEYFENHKDDEECKPDVIVVDPPERVVIINFWKQ